MSFTSARNSLDRIDISGLARPAASKMSTTPPDTTARETIWRTAKSRSSSDRAAPGARLAKAAPYRLEEGHIVANPQSVVVRHSQRECTREVEHRLQDAVLPVLLCQDVLLGRGQE